jgi:hypothetical protein
MVTMNILNLLGWMPNVSITMNLYVITLKIIDIIIGTFKNIFKLDNEISKSRMEICSECKDRDKNKCSLCGCILESKTRLKNAECPLSKWNKLINK